MKAPKPVIIHKKPKPVKPISSMPSIPKPYVRVNGHDFAGVHKNFKKRGM